MEESIQRNLPCPPAIAIPPWIGVGISMGGGDIIPPIIGVGDSIPGIGWNPMFIILAALTAISFEATEVDDIFLLGFFPSAPKQNIFT